MNALTLLLISLALTGLGTAQPDARDVLRRSMDNLRGTQLVAILEFTVTRPDRQTTYVLELISDGRETGLSRVLAPPRDAGAAFLREGDDLFLYNPRLGRVLRLPPSGRSDSFLGSDLTYADLSGRDLEHDYDVTIKDTTANTITLELTPLAHAPTPYGRVLLTVDAHGHAPLEQLYEDQRGEVVRSITFTDHVEAAGRHFPTTMVVDDLMRAGYQTTLTYREYQLNADIPTHCFTQRALEAGCR
jgi:outer membrane lipoprotein-sorting protein